MKIDLTIHGSGKTYRLTNTKSSSERLGTCEVCGKPVLEMHYLNRFRPYYRKVKPGVGLANIGAGVFGHKECCSQLTTVNLES
jgi:hypothetical protein